ncbi:MAG: pantoate--beta-alanine ligase [Bacteroidetes bacterium]|nr:MAG: pantoate--beta-alanine ligase [Bacteroidota bacterium]
MDIYKNSKDLRKRIDQYKQEGKRIGFFPTMGALHAGHMRLLHAAQKSCDIVVSSIFVNPTQFNNPDDLAKYPRTLPADLLLLQTEGCDVVYTPDRDDVYADEQSFSLDLKGLDSVLEGSSRPGHFDGVARVVKLLFEKVQPDVAYFGLKDFQQCMVIRQLVEQLEMPIQLQWVETSREDSGLARSSRNVRLSDAQRNAAAVIYRALQHCKANYSFPQIAQLEKEAIRLIEAEGFTVDYFQIVESENLQPNTASLKEPVALTAVYAGEVRLIDNLIL